MSINMRLFLQSIHAAFSNQHYEHGAFLLDYAIYLADHDTPPLSLSLPDVAIGLHPGCVRTHNEDCVLALQGTIPETQEVFGLFVVCDGMGGHAHGQEAAHLAVRTLLEYILLLLEGDLAHLDGERIIAEGIQQANRAIYQRNQASSPQPATGKRSFTTSQTQHMGTTITAVLLLGKTAYIANVGDSRTYLYDQSLSRITRDHSLVAQYLADGTLQEEDSYHHPQRNQITRALGARASVVVDTFVVPLQGHEILLLCSDGVWEMMRDHQIEALLASPWVDASSMAQQLVQMAQDGGGTDNIGCILIHLQQRTDIGRMDTVALDPAMVLSRLVPATVPETK